MLAIKTLTHKITIFRRTARLMGNRFEISVVGNNPIWADERIDAAIAEINRVEKLLSVFSEDSTLNEINRNAGIKPVKADPEIFRLIDRSLQIAELTHGAFDITYAVDTASAGFINFKNVELNQSAQTVFLKEKGMRIGFGANGKGYAADRAKYILQMQGVSSGVISAGGDLLTWGLQPGNEPWTIATADPDQKKQLYAHINISNMAIATSVNADNHTPINKKHLSAVMPVNGFQVSGIKSVSIISPNAELADAMASPVMAIGINAGLYLINQLNQMACIIIDDQGRTYTSKDVKLNN